ncbi:hypothetical protein SDC9_43996 [bioreactor metagenome]|jgi:hypothetical protein|uniref:Uncharacterized protein n=1 Tax=bioreactor metagenome TaxID=1076179 RepID=A0A644W284_9ZZZZ
MNEALGSPSLHKGEGELSFGDDSKIGTISIVRMVM